MTGVFPAGATLGGKSITRSTDDGAWVERQVLADGVTPHGVTRMFAKNEGVTYQQAVMVFWRGDQVEWTEFWPNGNVRAHSFEAYLGGPTRYEIFDENGTLVQRY